MCLLWGEGQEAAAATVKVGKVESTVSSSSLYVVQCQFVSSVSICYRNFDVPRDA